MKMSAAEGGTDLSAGATPEPWPLVEDGCALPLLDHAQRQEWANP
jgi:hypothetical protein